MKEEPLEKNMSLIGCCCGVRSPSIEVLYKKNKVNRRFEVEYVTFLFEYDLQVHG